MERAPRKRALICGINYPGTNHELRGCVNDANLISEILTSKFGFTTKDKRMLTDGSATTAAIKERLEWLVQDAQPGDTLWFSYSGHGSQFIDTSYDDDVEPDGLDEIICPVDLNWRDKMITDDDLKAIFNKVPSGVSLTVFIDACHSGTILDQVNQYQTYGQATRAMEFGPDSPNRSRLLPMPADIVNRGMGLHLTPKKRAVRNVDDTGLLISGCQSFQTSADAYLKNRYIGAATHALTEGLKYFNYNATYKQLVDYMNKFMVDERFSQRPELNGSAALFQEKFLSPKRKGPKK